MAGGELLGVAVLELRTDNRGLTTGLAAGRGQVQREGQAMQASMDRRLAAASASMGRVGSTMTRNLTVPIVALGAATGTMASRFEQAMEMIHTQAGASQREVAKLSDQVLGLAKVLPQGPQQLAQGLFHLESIGLRGAKAMGALKIAAEGAAVGNADLEQTATALGSAWLVNIKGAGSLQNVMGTLNATVGAGNMRMNDLVAALGVGLLPSAKAAGLSLQNILAALTVLTDEGYNASSAAAQLATALHFMYAPSQKAEDQLKTIGLSAADLSKDMHGPLGLLGALQDLKQHLKDLSAFKQEQVMNALMPAGRGRVLLTLLNQTDRYAMKINQIQHTSGQFAQDWAATQQTAAFKIKTAWSTIEADAIHFGEVVLPPLLDIGKEIVGIVDQVASAFSSLPPGAQHAIITGGLLLASVGPAMKILSVLGTEISRIWGVASMVQRLARGGGFRSPGAAAGALKANMLVDTMEVGTLIARNGLGGGGGVYEVGGARTAATAEMSTATEAGAMATASRLASKLMGGLMAGGMGLAVGSIVQEAIPGLKHGMAGTLAGSGLGAAIGTAIAPGVGTAIGAGIGATFGPTLQHMLGNFFESQATADGRTFTAGFVKQFGPGVHTAFQGAFRRAAKDAGDALTQLENDQNRVAHPTIPGAGRGGPHVKVPGPTPQDRRQIAEDAKKFATYTQHTYDAAFKGHPIDPRTLIQDFRDKLHGLNPVAKQAAAQGMLQFASELHAKGKLPEAAFVRIIKFLEQQSPGLANTLGYYGGQAAKVVANDFHFTKAKANLRSALADVKHQWQMNTVSTKGSLEDVLTNTGKAMANLKDAMHSGSSQARALATKQFKQLQQEVAGLMKQMLGDSTTKINAMAGAIQGGSKKAADSAYTQWKSVSRSVYAAMAAGVLSTKAGAQLLQQETNTILKAFGGKQIPVAAIKATEPHNSYDSVGGGIGHRATGGMMVDRPMFVVGEEAPQHPEVVIATNPAYRDDNLRYWLQAGRMLGVPGFAAGGYVYPMPAGFGYGRTDMGVDGSAPVGAPFGGIGPGHVLGVQPNWYAGQPTIWWQLDSGPMAGRVFYLGEQIQPLVGKGDRTDGHKAIARYASHGTAIEMGFGARYGVTQAQATGQTNGTGHDNTPAGLAFKAFLTGLAHGKIVDMGGGVSIPTVKAPHVIGGGTVGREAQLGLNKMTAAANAYIQKQAALHVPTGGGSFSFASAGPTEARIAADAKRVGVNKTGIAGIIGNAYRESVLNPASVGSGGGGLFGFTPLGPEQAFAHSRGKPWTDVDTQMAFMFQQWFAQDPGAISGINSQGSPARAADYFMNTYEHPGNKAQAEREAAANQAFAQGYRKGGVVRHPKRGGSNWAAHDFPHVYDWIHHATPQFPVKDLGRHWLHWLAGKMQFGRINPSSLSPKGVDEGLLGWSFNIANTIVPRLQERHDQLSNLWQNPTPGQRRHLTDLDRAAVAYSLWALHGLDRYEPAVRDRVKLLSGSNNKGAKKALGPWKNSLSRLEKQKRALVGLSGIGGTLGDAESALVGDLGGSGGAADKAQALLDLMRQRNQNLMEKLFVSRQQYRVLAGEQPLPLHPHHHHHPHRDPRLGPVRHFTLGPRPVALPPFGGSFAEGGVVPGAWGEPRTIIAHGGETVTNNGGDTYVVIDKKSDLSKLIDVRIERHDRATARHAHKMLPSRGGGRLAV